MNLMEMTCLKHQLISALLHMQPSIEDSKEEANSSPVWRSAVKISAIVHPSLPKHSCH